jgi:hypothetical protein
VLFLRETPEGLRLYEVALAGGPARQVMPVEVRAFDVSPVGDALAAVVAVEGRDRLQIGSIRGGELRDAPGSEELGKRLQFVRFAPDGRAVSVVGADAIVELELATGRARTVLRLESSIYTAIGELDYDSDGQTVVASLARSDGDIWVAEGRF